MAQQKHGRVDALELRVAALEGVVDQLAEYIVRLERKARARNKRPDRSRRPTDRPDRGHHRRREGHGKRQR